MSWNPLKRLPFSKQDSQQYASTSDYSSSNNPNSNNLNDLEVHIAEMAKLEKECKAILKFTKKLIENIASVNRYQMKISEDLSNSALCKEHYEELRALIEEWFTFNQKVNDLSEDYNLALQKVMIEPLKQFQQILNELKTLVKKCETNLSELTKQKTRVTKLEEKEKQAKDWVKLDQTKETFKKLQTEYDSQTETLLAELPYFLQCRVEYFQPMMEGFIKAESFYWGNTLKTFVLENQQNVSQFKDNRLDLDEYKTTQTKLLSNLTALSIVDGNE